MRALARSKSLPVVLHMGLYLLTGYVSALIFYLLDVPGGMVLAPVLCTSTEQELLGKSWSCRS